jgi:hypothetical protein
MKRTKEELAAIRKQKRAEELEREAEMAAHRAYSEEHKLEIALDRIEWAMKSVDGEFDRQREHVESIQAVLGRIAEDVSRSGDAREYHTWSGHSLYQPQLEDRNSMYGAAERVQHDLVWGFANIRWDLLMYSAQKLKLAYRYLNEAVEEFNELQHELGILPMKGVQ